MNHPVLFVKQLVLLPLYLRLCVSVQAILPHYETLFDQMERCVEANAAFLQDVITHGSKKMFASYWPEGCKVNDLESPTALDMDKAFCSL